MNSFKIPDDLIINNILISPNQINLSFDTWNHILSFLNFKDLVTFQLISKKFYEIYHENIIFKNIFIKILNKYPKSLIDKYYFAQMSLNTLLKSHDYYILNENNIQITIGKDKNKLIEIYYRFVYSSGISFIFIGKTYNKIESAFFSRKLKYFIRSKINYYDVTGQCVL